MSKTLEEVLRKRLTDSRAMTGVLNINADRVFLDFGQIGDIEKVRFRITDDEIILLYPRNDNPDPDGVLYGTGSNSAGRPTAPIDAVEREGQLFAGESGPEINLPDGLVVISEAELEAVMALVPTPEGEAGPDRQGVVVGGADVTNDGTTVAFTENAGASGFEPINPDDHLKPELIAIAEATPGIDFDANATKPVIADAINAARAKAAEEAKAPAPQD